MFALLLYALFLHPVPPVQKLRMYSAILGNVIIYGVGFTVTDFDSTIAIRYKQDNVFDSVIDTVHLMYAAEAGDTTYFNMWDTTSEYLLYATHAPTKGAPLANGFLAGYDYKIILPAIGKTYVLNGITQSGITDHTFTYTQGVGFSGVGPICWDNVVSCKINDTMYTFPSDYTKGSSVVYLHK